MGEEPSVTVPGAVQGAESMLLPATGMADSRDSTEQARTRRELGKHL
jgi:hypothetical protein